MFQLFQFRAAGSAEPKDINEKFWLLENEKKYKIHQAVGPNCMVSESKLS